MLAALVAGVASTILSQAHSDEQAAPDASASLAARGAILFGAQFTPEQGLGPLFNHTSCTGCHTVPAVGGMGPGGLGTATRIGRLTSAGFDPMIGHGGPLARSRSVAELGLHCGLAPGIPADANLSSVRNAPGLHGSGLIDAIPDEEILAGAVPRGNGVHGRPHLIRDLDGRQRVGRFGWKGDTATLRQFVADAFRNELGITSPLAPADFTPEGAPGRRRCPGEGEGVEDNGTLVDAVTAFVASLPPPSPSHSTSLAGETLFANVGCAACHTPSLRLGERRVPLYSDLLLHDLGPDLDDKVVQGDAGGRDWRTTPLWALSTRPRLLHDGRARTVTEAILAHGGEAEAARQRFRQLPLQQRNDLLTFLANL